MDQELAVAEENFQVPAMENKFADDFSLFTSGLFLPRLSLEGSNSTNFKKKKLKEVSYALITGRDQFEVLGTKVDIIVLSFRTKALDMSDKKNVVASYDKNSDLFKEIREKASIKGEGKRGYMYGLEFLVYIPSAKHEQKFATFFCGNPTMRVAAKDFAPILQSQKRTATLGITEIDNGTYVWEGPTVVFCNSPMPHYPSQEEMSVQMKTFANPIEGKAAEMATDEEADATARDR